MSGERRRERLGELTEAIYDAAITADWSDTMALFRRRYRSIAETLYTIELEDHRIREVYNGGIAPAYLKTLDEQFFTPDNPWRQVPSMHVPGFVRTDRRLAQHFRDPQVLRRSRYYNEWLRPQRLDHSLGVTSLVQHGSMANITLHRPAEIGPYRAAEVADLRHLGSHLRRALRVAQRLELQAAHRESGTAALDQLPYGVAFLAADGRLAYANGAAEALLRRDDALRLRGGRLVAADGRWQERLDHLLRAAAGAADGAAGPDGMAIPRADGGPALRLTAIPAPRRQGPLAGGGPAILLLIGPTSEGLPDRPPAGAEAALRRFGLSPAQTRLARALVAGQSLRQAAVACGITYQTARSYLKVIFHKAGVSRQSELVARLLAE